TWAFRSLVVDNASVELIESGVSGFLVSPNDAADMSKPLDLLLANAEHRRSISQVAREKMYCEFSVKPIVTHMTQVYEEALAAACAHQRHGFGQDVAV